MVQVLELSNQCLRFLARALNPKPGSGRLVFKGARDVPQGYYP